MDGAAQRRSGKRHYRPDGRDKLISPVNSERFKRDIKGSRLLMFDDLGCVPQEEEPARTVAVLMGFLEG